LVSNLESKGSKFIVTIKGAYEIVKDHKLNNKISSVNNIIMSKAVDGKALDSSLKDTIIKVLQQTDKI
jgi:hypothetical protein